MTDSKRRPSTSSVPVGTPLGTALQRLSADPYGRNSLDLVSAVATEVVNAMQAGKIEDPAAAVAELVGLRREPTASAQPRVRPAPPLGAPPSLHQRRPGRTRR